MQISWICRGFGPLLRVIDIVAESSSPETKMADELHVILLFGSQNIFGTFTMDFILVHIVLGGFFCRELQACSQLELY